MRELDDHRDEWKHFPCGYLSGGLSSNVVWELQIPQKDAVPLFRRMLSRAHWE